MEEISENPSILLTAIFKKFDINGHHKIKLSEFGDILKALASKTGEEQLKRMMLELDTDGDGYVDINEFKAIFCGSGENKALEDALDFLCDKDKKRKLSASQLHSILQDIGEKFSLKACRRMLRSVDVDGYGYLNFKEMEKKFRRRSPYLNFKEIEKKFRRRSP